MQMPTASVLWFQWQLFIHWKASKWTHGLKVSIRLFSLLVCICSTASQTQVRWTHLTFLCFFFPAPCPPSLWYNTTLNRLTHVATFSVCNSPKFVQRHGQMLPTNSKVTSIFTRKKKPFSFGSSVSDLIRVNKPQCGERNSMFSLLIGISRSDIRVT